MKKKLTPIMGIWQAKVAKDDFNHLSQDNADGFTRVIIFSSSLNFALIFLPKD